MIEINLLPKSYQKRSFSFSFGKAGIIAAVAVAGVVIMLASVTVYQRGQMAQLDENIQKARQRAAMLQKDIAIVDALNDVKAKINRRMSAVDKLDSHRSTWVKIMEDIAGNIPEFVWLVRFEEKPVETPAVSTTKTLSSTTDQTAKESAPVAPPTPTVRSVEIEGYAFTLNALAKLMINVMRSDYFEDVELVSSEDKFLDNEQKHRAHNFVLTCNLHYLSDEQLRGLIAKTDTGRKTRGSKTSHKVLN